VFIFHITFQKEWAKAYKIGTYTPVDFAKDGFIHCSSRKQVIKTANRFYSGQSGLVLLKIDTDLLKVPVKTENLEGGEELFPHIYGLLPIRAVTHVAALPCGKDGFAFPPNL